MNGEELSKEEKRELRELIEYHKASHSKPRSIDNHLWLTSLPFVVIGAILMLRGLLAFLGW